MIRLGSVIDPAESGVNSEEIIGLLLIVRPGENGTGFSTGLYGPDLLQRVYRLKS